MDDPGHRLAKAKHGWRVVSGRLEYLKPRRRVAEETGLVVRLPIRVLCARCREEFELNEDLAIG